AGSTKLGPPRHRPYRRAARTRDGQARFLRGQTCPLSHRPSLRSHAMVTLRPSPVIGQALRGRPRPRHASRVLALLGRLVNYSGRRSTSRGSPISRPDGGPPFAYPITALVFGPRPARTQPRAPRCSRAYVSEPRPARRARRSGVS